MGNEVWRGRGVWGAVDGEVILRLGGDSSTLLAICYTLVVEDEFVRKMIGLSFREVIHPSMIDHTLMTFVSQLSQPEFQERFKP